MPQSGGAINRPKPPPKPKPVTPPKSGYTPQGDTAVGGNTNAGKPNTSNNTPTETRAGTRKGVRQLKNTGKVIDDPVHGTQGKRDNAPRKGAPRKGNAGSKAGGGALDAFGSDAWKRTTPSPKSGGGGGSRGDNQGSTSPGGMPVQPYDNTPSINSPHVRPGEGAGAPRPGNSRIGGGFPEIDVSYTPPSASFTGSFNAGGNSEGGGGNSGGSGNVLQSGSLDSLKGQDIEQVTGAKKGKRQALRSKRGTE